MPKIALVRYEWVIETLDEYDDIADVSHSERIQALPIDDVQDVALMRDAFDQYGDLDSRGYAYINNGVMETEFDSGHKVPKRFLAEFEKFKAKQ